MKQKILLAVSLLALSNIGMSNSVQDILKKARDDYYKEQKEAAAPKVKKEKPAKEETKETSAVEETEEPQVVYEEEEVVEEVKPKTPLEKLEANAEKAMIKVDFYERVVRSVAREEKELGSYDEILGKKKPKKENKKETKTTTTNEKK